MQKNNELKAKSTKRVKAIPQRKEPHIDRTTTNTDETAIGPDHILEAARTLIRCWAGERALQRAVIPVQVGHETFTITIVRQ